MALSANYVKFLRGTPAAFANLAQKDSDTIYFIYEENNTYGNLYIGERLVASGVQSGEVGATLGSLSDVDVSVVSNGQVLGYDSLNKIWKPMSLPEAVRVSVMVGASETEAGQAGYVPAPQAGDHTKFLRGDGTWVDISSLGGLTYKKVNSTDEIDLNAADAGKFIYLVPRSDGTFKEYVVIDNTLEELGNTEVSLDGYVTTEQLTNISTRVSSVEDQLNSFVQANIYNAKVEEIDGRLSDLERIVSWGALEG